ncbi:MAG: hypothetical protein R3F24_06810 [Gammaproteobacteria bacterium]
MPPGSTGHAEHHHQHALLSTNQHGQPGPAEPEPRPSAAGNYPLAAASIERALRIDPRQPLLWLELGEIRASRKASLPRLTQAVGRKALSLSTGDATLTARAEELISPPRRSADRDSRPYWLH